VEALAAYERLRKRLTRQFGIDPSPPLQELEVELLRQDPKLGLPGPAAQPVPTAPAQDQARPENSQGSLPFPLTSFIGREAEMAGVVALAGRYRMVTIAGPGGCGKTRLAIAAGHRLATDMEVRFVRLEGLTDPGLVPVAVAEALGVRPKTGPSSLAELAGALADRDVLVILDNCEHLLAACAALVATILESTAGVRFLLTSREQLAVPGEVVRRLRSLVAPEPGDPPEAIENAEAVRLFLDRAATALGTAADGPAHTGEPLGRDALPAVSELCRRLDGIPLAIELAAARLVTLSLDQLAERLADRFGVLSTGPRTVRPRHRTLLAAMAWSHDLLDEPERCLFRRLSVFASAFPLEAAEFVCADDTIGPGDVCDLLARLAGKSLVTVERDSGAVGYRMLSTIREYAASWLRDPAERHEVARRHHDWCLAQATRAARALHDGDQIRWTRRVRAWIDDVRTALDWALRPEGESVALAAAMWPLWDLWGQDREGRQWIDRALTHRGSTANHEASLLLGAAVFARAADEYDQAHRFLDQATARYEAQAPPEGLARCRLERGRLLVVECQLGPAAECARQARQQYQDMADTWGVAWADVLAGNVLMVRGEYPEAAEAFSVALEAGRRIDNPAIIGDACVFLGLVAVRSDRVADARPYFEEALRIGRMLARDALRVCRRIGAHSPVPQCLEVLARACQSLGDNPRAATLFGAADRTRRDLGLVTTEAAPAQAPAYDQDRQRGAALTIDEAISLALDEG
jgi:predicted ATPase